MSNNIPNAVIFGCQGKILTDEEKRFFKHVNPLGFILFARNIETPDQVKSLVVSLRECVERSDVPILIDQEGGRVQRLKPPHWIKRPCAQEFGRLYEKDPSLALEAVHVNTRLIGQELNELGIDVNCLPLLDLPVEGGHDVIGDRAFSPDIRAVGELGVSVCEGLLAQNVMPIVKHIPGHGRAKVDSHLSLPVVDEDLIDLERTDFEPFKKLASAPWGMTAHILYTAIDPDKPASLSKRVIQDVIRGYIGFKGFLLCDDLSMKALQGNFASLTVQTLDAGCDAVLHCNGDMSEMQAIASVIRPLSDASVLRIDRANLMRAKAYKNRIQLLHTNTDVEAWLA